MDLEKAEELLKKYHDADIFEQNHIAVEFVELFGDKLLGITKNSNDDTNLELKYRRINEEMKKIGRIVDVATEKILKGVRHEI